MLTLFAIPKPFQGHFGIIQRNAVRSWKLLRPRCQIILFGNEEGTAEIAQEFSLKHIPEVARNEYGTPLLNSLFEQAQKVAEYPLLTYVNADIILLNDFTAAVSRIPFRRFLMVGRRWNLDVNGPLDFAGTHWQNRLRESIRNHGIMGDTTTIDYFVFTSGVWGEIPPFAIGRVAWDNWLIYRARAHACKVVDSSLAVTAVHQNHDYSHIRTQNETDWQALRKGPEVRRNLELAGGRRMFGMKDATWILPANGLVRPVLSFERLKRQVETLPMLSSRSWHSRLIHPLLSVVLACWERRLTSAVLRCLKRLRLSSLGN